MDYRALTYMPNPEEKWANSKDCVDFPCTGPVQVVIHIEDAKYTSSRRMLVDDD